MMNTKPRLTVLAAALIAFEANGQAFAAYMQCMRERRAVTPYKARYRLAYMREHAAWVNVDTGEILEN